MKLPDQICRGNGTCLTGATYTAANGPTRGPQLEPICWTHVVKSWIQHPECWIQARLEPSSRRQHWTLMTVAQTVMAKRLEHSSEYWTRVDGYDHAALVICVEMNVDLIPTLCSARKKCKLDAVLSSVSPLDNLFIKTLEAGQRNYSPCTVPCTSTQNFSRSQFKEHARMRERCRRQQELRRSGAPTLQEISRREFELVRERKSWPYLWRFKMPHHTKI
jgi:hypothetical protein